jgi:hypothetical protein
MILFRKTILFLICPLLTVFMVNGQNRSIDGDSRKFKLAPVQNVKSTIGPTMDGGRLGVDRLIDGKLPDSGWRSTWTVWMKKNPRITFNLGTEKRIGVIRVYFQPWDRPDELMELKVEVSRDGENFILFNEYEGFVAEKGKAVWAEVDLRAVKAQYFRLTPQYQGWGNQWGEVEFWEIGK